MEGRWDRAAIWLECGPGGYPKGCSPNLGNNAVHDVYTERVPLLICRSGRRIFALLCGGRRRRALYSLYGGCSKGRRQALPCAHRFVLAAGTALSGPLQLAGASAGLPLIVVSMMLAMGYSPSPIGSDLVASLFPENPCARRGHLKLCRYVGRCFSTGARAPCLHVLARNRLGPRRARFASASRFCFSPMRSKRESRHDGG